MTKVVATGVFELLHPGHILFLEEAKKLGDELIVIVARDKNVRKNKRKPVVREKQRLRVIKSLKVVDKAILGDKEDMFKPVLEIKPDIIALGKNQKFDENELRKKLSERGIDVNVVRINKFLDGDLSSTGKIIEKIREIY